jgi:hypothetical protein
MIKYQNYKHYKLPITLKALEYGKLIYHNNNIYIVSFNRTNLALITQFDSYNQVKFYKEGNLIFEYKDHKIDNNSFIRSLENKNFTFKDGILIIIESLKTIRTLKSTIILNIYKMSKLVKFFVNIYKSELFILFLIGIIFLVIFPEDTSNLSMAGLSGKNIIKLRKTTSKYI